MTRAYCPLFSTSVWPVNDLGEIVSHVFTTSNGNVTQPAALIRLYGI